MPAGDMPAGGRGQAFQYPAGELITSSLSNKGNATAFGQDNTFRVLEQNAVRIIDNKGNLLFSGTGPEAARQAVEIGKNLSDTLGNKAGWTIQTGERTINPDGSVGATRFYDVANEKVNKSTLDKIAGVVGTALPIAVGFIPGFGQLACGGLYSRSARRRRGIGFGRRWWCWRCASWPRHPQRHHHGRPFGCWRSVSVWPA